MITGRRNSPANMVHKALNASKQQQLVEIEGEKTAMNSINYKTFQLPVIYGNSLKYPKVLTFLLKTTEEEGRILGRLEGFMNRDFDNINQAVSELSSWLGINETYLAGFLGVSPKSLTDWKKRSVGDLPPKASRLVRLYEVVCYLRKHYPDLQKNYKGLLENGHIVIDPENEDEGTISLLNFILEEPNAKAWVPCVNHVVAEYRSILTAAGKYREANKPIRHAL